MAQDIVYNGTNYLNVPSVNLPTPGGGKAKFTDVSDVTPLETDVLAGKIFYKANGEPAIGTINIGQSIPDTSGYVKATKDIYVMKKTFEGVPAVNYKKVGGGDAHFVDISDTTADDIDVVNGVEYYNADGYKCTGALGTWKNFSTDNPIVVNAIPYKTKETTLNFDPIVNDNGYGHSWEAGDGVNQFNIKNAYVWPHTDNGITWTVNADGSVTANGTATSMDQAGYSVKLPAGDYYFSGCPEGGSSTTWDCHMYDDGISATAKQWDGVTESVNDYGTTLDNQVKITDSSIWYGIVLQVKKGVTVSNLVFKPMIRRSTSTVTQWEPYENVSHIDGRAGINLTVNGITTPINFPSEACLTYISKKNLVNQATMTNNTPFIYNNAGAYNQNDNTYVTTIPVLPNSVYTVSFSGSGYVRTAELTSEDAFIKRTIGNSPPFVVTTSATTAKLQIAADKTATNIQIEHGKSATEYEEFHKTVSTGKVFGGVVSLTSGELAVKYKKVVISDDNTPLSLTTSEYGNRCDFYIPDEAINEDTDDIFCTIGSASSLVNTSNYSEWEVGMCALHKETNGMYFRYIFPTSITAASDALIYLINYHCEIAIPVAEPETFDMGVSEIQTVFGTNAISFSDGVVINSTILTVDDVVSDSVVGKAIIDTTAVK